MPNPAIDIKVDASQLIALGKRFKKVDLQRGLQRGIEKFAFTIERFSKISSPIDTGRMRASIATDIGNLHARIAPHVRYAIFVHSGTKFMRARPFMRIGLEEAKVKLFGNITNNEIVSEIKEELNKQL